MAEEKEPKDARVFDVVVYGASGFTGQYVIEELALHAPGIKWCVSGRDSAKISKTLDKVAESAGKNLKSVVILEANAYDGDALDVMCRKTKVVINCVGPYRFTGEAVVAACVRNKTHHIDVSGEPQFLENIQLKYFKEAVSSKIYIIGACGFDSIPCDLGTEILRKKFNGDMNGVETYVSAKRPPGSTANFATWQSAIHGIAHQAELKPLRKQLIEDVFPKRLPKSQYPLLKRYLFKSDDANGWCLPFPGSDKSVVTRSQMYNYEYKNIRPFLIQTYFRVPSLLTALLTIMMAGFFLLLTKVSYGRYLLEKFPGIFSFGMFSKDRPEYVKGSDGSFTYMFIGNGWSEKLDDPSENHTTPPNKVQKAVMKGPDAYATTAIFVVASALVLINETHKLPGEGGVLTPAVAFSDTSFMERVEERGITMQILDSK